MPYEDALSKFTRSQFHQHFYVRIFRPNGISAAFSSYILALAKKFVRKMRMFNVDEIDGRSQFHQHFMCAYFGTQYF